MKNNTEPYSDPQSNSQDPNTTHSVPTFSGNGTQGAVESDADGDGVDDKVEAQIGDASRVKTDIIAGVVSGGVVVVKLGCLFNVLKFSPSVLQIGGGIFLTLSVYIYRRRQQKGSQQCKSKRGGASR